MAERSDSVDQREFGLSHDDVSRILPRVWPTFDRLAERAVRISLGETGAVEITLSEQKYRRLATLKIPYIDIEFRFFSVTDSQRTEFYEKFERAFQKGGG